MKKEWKEQAGKKERNPNEEEVKIKIDGFFLAIGHKPNSEFSKNILKLMRLDILKRFPVVQKQMFPVFLHAVMYRILFIVRQSLLRVQDVWPQWMLNVIFRTKIRHIFLCII